MLQPCLAMVLWFKGGLGGGGGGGAFALLLVLALLVLAGYVAVYAIGGLVGMFSLLFERQTKATSLDLEYLGPLCSTAKVAVIVLGLAGWIAMIVIPVVRDTDVSWLYIAAGVLYPFAFFYLYQLWKHFFFRRLYKMGELRAKRVIRMFLVGLALVAAVSVYVLAATSAGGRIDRFDRMVERAEQSPEVLTGCFLPGVALGMDIGEYYEVIGRMREHDSVMLSDYDGNTLYVTYSTDRDRSMSITPTFANGRLAMLHFGDYGGLGSDSLKADIVRSGMLAGFRRVKVPPAKINSRGDLRYPRHMHDFCNIYVRNRLYNYDDELYIKDNMLVVFTVMGVSFVDMPFVKGF